MSAQSPVPKDHPMMIAWESYKATDEYANSKHWAQYKEHVDGSLWASFITGWESQAKRISELEKQRDVLEAVANRAQETERLLRERLMDVRMYLLNEADKHSPRDPVLGEAYQMTQRHLGWRPEPAAIDAAKEQQ